MIGFRPLSRDDFPLMHRWLNEAHVRRWWTPELPTLADVEAKYGPRVDGGGATRPYAILRDDLPIGYVQTYLIHDYPEYAGRVGIDEVAAGVDIFIGEPSLVHRGLGAPILRAFLAQVVFARPDVTACVIGPAVSNTSAIRAYEKAGFVHFRTVAAPGEPEPEYLMIARPPVGQGSAHGP